jgi:signal transduction histidine kinase
MPIHPDPDTVRLRRALRDLVALSAIPSAWVGREPPAIAGELADMLATSLRLDFVFVRLRDPNGGAVVEIKQGDPPPALLDWLQDHVAEGVELSSAEIIPSIGDDTQGGRGIVIPVGFNAEGGLVAAVCDRPDFPDELDRLLLSVAANHAAVAFRMAHLVDDHRRAEASLRNSERDLRKIRDGLEMKVAERTAELRRNEGDLRVTQAQLARASQAATVAELSASIAHEINQPLAGIVASGETCRTWLSGDNPNLPRARAAIERIIRDGNAAADIIRRIRALFGRTAPAKTSLQINEVIDEVRRLAQDELDRRRISLELDLTQALPPVLADRIQIQQVLMNLIRNGAEAMEHANSQAKRLVVRSQCAGGYIIVEVCDHGVGLTHPEKVFEPFYSTKPNGLGVGLAISRSIVEAHEGVLRVRDNQPQGTVFYLTLPLRSEAGHDAKI